MYVSRCNFNPCGYKYGHRHLPQKEVFSFRINLYFLVSDITFLAKNPVTFSHTLSTTIFKKANNKHVKFAGDLIVTTLLSSAANRIILVKEIQSTSFS